MDERLDTNDDIEETLDSDKNELAEDKDTADKDDTADDDLNDDTLAIELNDERLEDCTDEFGRALDIALDDKDDSSEALAEEITAVELTLKDEADESGIPPAELITELTAALDATRLDEDADEDTADENTTDEETWDEETRDDDSINEDTANDETATEDGTELAAGTDELKTTTKELATELAAELTGTADDPKDALDAALLGTCTATLDPGTDAAIDTATEETAGKG